MRALLTSSRLRRVASVASAQALVQGLGFVAGIVLVRALSPVQYGYYTMAVALVGVACVLTELGVSNAVMAIGGRLVGQRAAMRGLVDGALSLQTLLAVVAPFVIVPVFVLMLRHQQATLAQAFALVTLAVLNALFSVRVTIAQSVARLEGRVAIQQKADLATNLARVLLLGVASLVALDATIASALNMAAVAGGFVFWHGWLRRELGAPGSGRGEHAAALRDSVRRQAPNGIYYVLNGQISVWLMSLFGSAEKIAQIGALGRLGAGFAVIVSVVSTLAMPYFARNEEPAQLESGFVALNAFFGALTGLLTAAAMLAPAPMLWVLGRHYAGLDAELVWMVMAISLTAWSGALYAVACARGWVLPARLGIGCGVLATLAGLALFDLATVAGNLQVTTLTAFVAVLVNAGWLGHCLLRHRRIEAPSLGKALP